MTNERINDLAIQYAVTIVTYNECKLRNEEFSTQSTKVNLRISYNEMCAAMNTLNAAALNMAYTNILG